MADTFPVCRHCGARIELINFSMGPEWRHWPTPYGNYRTDAKYRYCRTAAVAEPLDEPVGQLFAHRGAIYFCWAHRGSDGAQHTDLLLVRRDQYTLDAVGGLDTLQVPLLCPVCRLSGRIEGGKWVAT